MLSGIFFTGRCLLLFAADNALNDFRELGHIAALYELSDFRCLLHILKIGGLVIQ